MDLPEKDMALYNKALAYATKQHDGQTRKGEGEIPYITHPINVTNILYQIGGIRDVEILMAATLHDTIEDTNSDREDIVRLFGERVAGLVCEMTDNKEDPKFKRKLDQIYNTPRKSTEGKCIKLADKIANLTDLAENPPMDWDLERKQNYCTWAHRVVVGARGVNPALEAKFDEAYANAMKVFSDESREGSEKHLDCFD